MKKPLKILLLVCSLIICSVTAVACSSLSDTVDQLLCSHVYDDGVVTKETSCSEHGTLTKTCTLCGKTKDEEIALLNHVPMVVSVVEPTCTESGKTEGVLCDVCGFEIVPQQVVVAKGHVVVKDYGKVATCLESGLTNGSHCSVCDVVVVEQEVIPATGHTLVSVEAVDSTCSSTGHSAYSYCSTCNVKYGYEEYSRLEHNFVDGLCTECSFGNNFSAVMATLENPDLFTKKEVNEGDKFSFADYLVIIGADVFFESESGEQFHMTPNMLYSFSFESSFCFPDSIYIVSDDGESSIVNFPVDEDLFFDSYSDISFRISSTELFTVSSFSSIYPEYSGPVLMYSYTPVSK